mgnify:CR=1 FL=1
MLFRLTEHCGLVSRAHSSDDLRLQPVLAAATTSFHLVAASTDLVLCCAVLCCDVVICTFCVDIPPLYLHAFNAVEVAKVSSVR